MSSLAFQTALKATGYFLPSGEPAPGLTVAGQHAPPQLRPLFGTSQIGLAADAVFINQKRPISIFKDAGEEAPSDEQVRHWHEAAWNVGVAPLLWVVTPTDVHLYDCYKSPALSHPQQSVPTEALNSYSLNQVGLQSKLNRTCGRLATESGAFWSEAVGCRIDRQHRVDRELFAEINALEKRLVQVSLNSSDQQSDGFAVDFAQRLIGRCIFTWYLLDRNLAQRFLPADLIPDLKAMFKTEESVFRLFDWLRSTFNGDLFPMDEPEAELNHLNSEHLEIIRSFIDGYSLVSGQEGQGRLFRFRFEAIPSSLISSIYEQFARSIAADQAVAQSLHYTPVEVVHFVLDPVFEGLPVGAKVIDPACGSGTFLVEAFRRLVWREAGGQTPTRDLIRRVLYEQLFGIDLNPAALRISAFGLYLAAIELDEEPVLDLQDLRFDRLIGRTLFKSDAVRESLPSSLRGKKFEAVVGNPPWTLAKTVDGDTQPAIMHAAVPRSSPDHRFLQLAREISSPSGRIGMIMKATPFFSADQQAANARNKIFEELKPCALINLSLLREEDLFPDAKDPSLIFFARCKLTPRQDDFLVGSIPWSRDFYRSGVFQMGPGEIRPVSLDRVLAVPSILKASAFGSVRDEWLLERLNRDFPTLGEVLEELGFLRGGRSEMGFMEGGTGGTQGFEEDHRDPVWHEFTPFRLRSMHGKFAQETPHRPRQVAIFRGPLILCPAALQTAPETLRGRYCVAISEDDLLCSSSLFGISLASMHTDLIRVLPGVLNSSLTTFQLALGGPDLGLERTTVNPHNIPLLRIPWPGRTSANLLGSVAAAEKRAAESAYDIEYLRALDEAVFDLYELELEERVLAAEAIERTRHLSFQTKADHERMLRSPSSGELRDYGSEVVQTVNAYLEACGTRHLEAIIYREPLEGASVQAGLHLSKAVRFAIAQGRPMAEPVLRQGDPQELSALVAKFHGQLSSQPPPYLNESRQIRIYGREDVTIIKPAQWRYWSRTAGLNDADKILADHWYGKDRANGHR